MLFTGVWRGGVINHIGINVSKIDYGEIHHNRDYNNSNLTTNAIIILYYEILSSNISINVT